MPTADGGRDVPAHGRSQGHWRVLPGSGTGELADIRGKGAFEALGGLEVTYWLDHELG